MNKEQYAIHEVLLDFARRHLTSRGVFSPHARPAEIDEVVQRIDEARGIGEEADEGPDQLTPAAAELAKVLVNQTRGATYALKKSAYADVVGAIIECQRFLDEFHARGTGEEPDADQVEGRNQVFTYLKTLRAFEAGLVADLGIPRPDDRFYAVEDENNGT